MSDFAVSAFADQVLAIATATTAHMGQTLSRDFSQLQIEAKADGSLVTQADQWADQYVRGAIAQEFPSHGLLTEEHSHVYPGGDWCWVIDPLDGTTNFARGLPIWGISLALLYQGSPVFGYLHLPPLQQSYYGWLPTGLPDWPATGAWLTSALITAPVPLTPSQADPSPQHFFSFCSRSWPYLRPEVFPAKGRIMGAAAYNLVTVASGATLGAVEANPKVWDIAAAWVIVKAVGADWQSLSPPVFPLVAGKDYGDRPCPTLALSQARLRPHFQPSLAPLLQHLASPVTS